MLEPNIARADALTWDPAWPRFRSSEYLLTGVAGVASFALYFGVDNAREPRWVGGVLFDDAVRGAVRLHSQKQRGITRFTSDLAALSMMAWVIGFDSLAVPVVRRKSDVAGQLLLMDAEAVAVSTLLANSLFKVIGRARPSYADCEQDPYYDSLCHLNDTSSFPSGHANFTFTAAGLACAHHLHLSLYGNRFADILACSGSLGLAGLTSSLRIYGDRHYVTDVVAGAALGFAVGFGLPSLLHYRSGASQASGTMQTAQALDHPIPLGPSFAGTF